MGQPWETLSVGRMDISLAAKLASSTDSSKAGSWVATEVYQWD